jgi:hypothetical protein
VRQLFYPYRKWRLEIPRKATRPLFFCTLEIADKRLYKFWEYEFIKDGQYRSMKLKRGETFLVEPVKKRLTVDELLREHITGRIYPQLWDVPQADSFWRVAEIPLLIAQGINTSDKVAKYYHFDPRQSSYYRQASEFLGLVRQERDFGYVLTDLGSQYVNLPADERRQLLAGLLAHFPPMRAALELSAKASAEGIGKKEIAELIEHNSKISNTTPARRASTILAWLQWLQQATGAVQKTDLGFAAR